jgi:hypothetical protein
LVKPPKNLSSTAFRTKRIDASKLITTWSRSQESSSGRYGQQLPGEFIDRQHHSAFQQHAVPCPVDNDMAHNSSSKCVKVGTAIPAQCFVFKQNCRHSILNQIKYGFITAPTLLPRRQMSAFFLRSGKKKSTAIKVIPQRTASPSLTLPIKTVTGSGNIT